MLNAERIILIRFLIYLMILISGLACGCSAGMTRTISNNISSNSGRVYCLQDNLSEKKRRNLSVGTGVYCPQEAEPNPAFMWTSRMPLHDTGDFELSCYFSRFSSGQGLYSTRSQIASFCLDYIGDFSFILNKGRSFPCWGVGLGYAYESAVTTSTAQKVDFQNSTLFLRLKLGFDFINFIRIEGGYDLFFQSDDSTGMLFGGLSVYF